MKNYCPKCGCEITTIRNGSGVECSVCDWSLIKPKPPKPKRMADYFGLLVRVSDGV